MMKKIGPLIGLVILAGIAVLISKLSHIPLRQTTSLAGTNLTRKVIGNLVYWDQARGYQTIQNNSDVFSEVSPFWYTLDSSGNVVPYGAGYIDPAIVSYLHSKNILVTPTFTDGSSPAISTILSATSSRATLENQIISIVNNQGYDGVDIDYEDLLSTDRNNYSAFITELASSLHSVGKRISVFVYAKTSEPGTWNGTISEDWKALGSAVDELRVSTYGHNYPGADLPQAISPLDWIQSVLSFGLTEVPASKLVQGVGLYGEDWVSNTTTGTDLQTWTDATNIATNYGATIQRDATSQEPWFNYTNSSGQAHTVWFQDGISTNAQLQLTNKNGIAGIQVWRLGGEDPTVWNMVRNQFAISTATPIDQILANNTANSVTIPYNTAATISWTSQNASSCTVSPTGWTGLSNAGISTGNLTIGITYTLTCSNANGSTSSSVTVNVSNGGNDIIPPTVSITSPTNGATVSSTKQTIAATATDNVAVQKVQFYVDNVLLGTDTYAPYTYSWSTKKAAKGSHVITVTAVDTSGNKASASITVYK